MRRHIVLIAAAVLSAVVIATVAGCGGTYSGGAGSTGGSTSSGSTGSGAAQSTADVTIKGYAFEPSSVEVKVGGTVKWTNEDGVDHQVVGEGWGGDAIPTGKTYSNTFDTAGTYQYHCAIHPSMTGEVTVK